MVIANLCYVELNLNLNLTKGGCTAAADNPSLTASTNKYKEKVCDPKSESFNANKDHCQDFTNSEKISDKNLLSKESESLTVAPPQNISIDNNSIALPLYKRRGVSETPEIQRKSRKLFPRYRNIETDVYKRSLTAPSQNTSTTSTPACSPPSSTGNMSISASIVNTRSSSTGSGHEGSGSSRKSSISSGAKKSGGGKQFAVTLLVNEAEKNKIVDMLHRAKQVISKKVEKVMGKRPKSTQANNIGNTKGQTLSISNAEALTTVLQNWVEVEEKNEKKEENEMQLLIKEQKAQAYKMRQSGIEPPLTIITPPQEHSNDIPKQGYFRSPGIPTLSIGGGNSFGSFPSPVPEETEDEYNEADDETDHDDDLEVQEIKEGDDNLLRLPYTRRFRLSRSITPQSPTRSLSPCDTVPRFFSRPESELYPANLRRPSSHYDVNAQAASSRPLSTGQLPNKNRSPVNVPFMNNTNVISPQADACISKAKIEKNESERGKEGKLILMSPNNVSPSSKPLPTQSELKDSVPEIEETTQKDEGDGEKKNEVRFDYDRDIPISSWQRPESMTIPIGGVWHPGQSDDEDEFMKNLSFPVDSSSSCKSPLTIKPSSNTNANSMQLIIILLN